MLISCKQTLKILSWIYRIGQERTLDTGVAGKVNINMNYFAVWSNILAKANLVITKVRSYANSVQLVKRHLREEPI